MSVDTLRVAAQALRDEWGGGLGGAWNRPQRFHLAVADWIDRTADIHDELAPLGLNQPIDPWPLAVARAYLGETS